MTVKSTIFTLAGALAAMVVAANQAQAASYTFDGVNGAGVDPLGQNYVLGPNFIGTESFQESAGQQTDPTNEVTFTAGHGLADATSFTLTETGATDPLLTTYDYAFDHYVPGGEGDYWNPTFVSPTEITFTAPAGDKLVTGDQFFTYVGFQNAIPAGFSYQITWQGDAAVSAAPEPSSWALMIIGLGGAGLMLRRARKPSATSGLAFAN